MGIYTSLSGEMVCPRCGETNTHLNTVGMAPRQPSSVVEPAPELPKSRPKARAFLVNVSNGKGASWEPTDLPSKHVGAEHRIALVGWCESCLGAFAWLFTQRKGVTLVESFDLGDTGMAEVHLESEAERRFWTAYQAARPTALDGMVTQHKVLRYRLDFAVPAKRFGIEIDGYEFHSTKEAFTNDRRRQRELEMAGWRIVRFSGKEAIDSPERCVREAAAAAAAFGPASDPQALGALLPEVVDELADTTAAARADDLRAQTRGATA